MPNYTIVGDGDIEFGAGGATAVAVGQVQSASHQSGGEELALKDEDGNTFLIIFFDDKGECELEAIWDTGYALPARGDIIAICEEASAIVKTVTKKWSEGKEVRITIKAVAHLYVNTA